MSRKILVTSALPYANGYIHLGHCSGAYLPADIFVRYNRLKGEEVLYVCGSDEHGVAITIAADKEKVSPKDIIDKYHNSNKDAFEKLGISFDIFSRTSYKEHHEIAKEFFKDFLDKKLLIERETEQFYDEQAKMFLPDRYVEGICPNCGAEHARGDQCDSCGAYYNQTELKNPISLISGNTPTLKKTVHWYFRFELLQSFLEKYIEKNAKNWKDNVIQQSRSWLKAGLSERAITRDLSWGVSIDDIAGVDKHKAAGKVLYVWFDAVLGYISATKRYFDGKEDWKNWWQDENTEYYAFIGKDNIVFHTLIFPAMLESRKDNDNPYILPKNVPANEFLNLEGQKFSKSRNWSIDLKDFLKENGESKKIDALRYTLTMNFPETKDADFTWKDYQTRNNSELSAILGNYVNRVITFIHKQYDSKVPELAEEFKYIETAWEKGDTTGLEENDKLLLNTLLGCKKSIDQNYNKFRFRDALSETMKIARAANKYFNDEEPWKAIKANKIKADKTMYFCCQLLNTLSIIFAPVIPFTAKKIQEIIGKDYGIGEPNTDRKNIWENAFRISLVGGTSLKNAEILFDRIEEEFIEKEKSKLGSKNKAQDMNNMIDIELFSKIELKTAKVVKAEKIEKSKKLLKLQVEIGDVKKQIIAGIGEHYDTSDIIDKTVIVVNNLKPAKLMGEKSEGMLLAVNNDNGELTIVSPEKETISGQTVR